jgi:hypothetical protein
MSSLNLVSYSTHRDHAHVSPQTPVDSGSVQNRQGVQILRPSQPRQQVSPNYQTKLHVAVKMYDNSLKPSLDRTITTALKPTHFLGISRIQVRDHAPMSSSKSRHRCERWSNLL